MNKKTPIVLVYLGKKLPKYVLKNIEYLCQSFDGHNVYLVSDNPVSLQKAAKLGAKVWQCSNPELTWSEANEQLAYSKRFRNNFWFLTIGRFSSLLEFMESNRFESILHIEADVWISHNFPISKFRIIGSRIAYPLTNLDEGIASTLYIGSQQVLRNLVRFSVKSIKENPRSTDVTILGSFYRYDSDGTFILPSAIPNKKIFREYISQDAYEAMTRNYNIFEGVFDGSTMGIYFTGIDPRNAGGNRRIFEDQKNHALDCTKIKFSVNNQDESLHVSCELQEAEVFSLHIHSKDIRIFDCKNSFSRLSYLSSLNKDEPQNEFLGIYTFYILIRDLNYKFRMFVRRFIK